MRKGIKKIALGNSFLWSFAIVYTICSFHLLYNSYVETIIFKKILQTSTYCLKTDQEKFIALNNKINEIMYARQKVFENIYNDFDFSILQSADSHLQTVSGACGSYAIVLARTLQVAGYKVRLPQMYLNGKEAGHILVEAEIDHSWAVADPMYAQYFMKENHRLASFEEVSKSWDQYRHQVSKEYPSNYKYENARYTNWNKIPILGPGINKMLKLFYGEKETRGISLRTYFLNQYLFGFFIITFFFAPIFSYLLFKRIKLKYNNKVKIAEPNRKMKSQALVESYH